MNKKELLIMETYRLFAEKGYSLSLSEVTSALGIKKQSIYNYFPSKDALISEMFEYVSAKYFKDLKTHIDSTQNLDAKEKLLSTLSYIVEFFSNPTHLRLRRWVSLNLHKEEHKLIAVYALTIRKNIEEIISKGVEDGDIKDKDIGFMSNFFIIIVRGIIDGLLIMDEYIGRTETLETIFDEYWSIIKADKPASN